MLDEARRWAETQFATADLGDARRTHRLVGIMAAIARAPDESLPRQRGPLANTRAGHRLFDWGAPPRRAPQGPAWPRMAPQGPAGTRMARHGPAWPRMDPP